VVAVQQRAFFYLESLLLFQLTTMTV